MLNLFNVHYKKRINRVEWLSQTLLLYIVVAITFFTTMLAEGGIKIRLWPNGSWIR